VAYRHRARSNGRADDRDGIRVTVECVLAGEQPFQLTARIDENAAAKTVTYSSEIATAILGRCD
jgi:hypothetical protein